MLQLCILMCSKFYFHHDEDITRVLEQFKLTNDSCLKFVGGTFVGSPCITLGDRQTGAQTEYRVNPKANFLLLDLQICIVIREGSRKMLTSGVMIGGF